MTALATAPTAPPLGLGAHARGEAITEPVGDWLDDAACGTDDDTRHLWDLTLPGEHRRGRDERHDQALAICARCPVRAQCARAGRVNDEAGVWGGQIRVPDWYPSTGELRSERTTPPR